MGWPKHRGSKTGGHDAEDRRLAELQTTVLGLIGKPIEDATAADRELLRSTLSERDMRAVNEYARLMQAAIGTPCLTSRTKTRKQNQEAQLGIRLDSWLKARLEEIAEREERSVAQLVRRVLKDFVSQRLPRPDGGGSEEGTCEQKQQRVREAVI
jgi:predicted transcriptional regulator